MIKTGETKNLSTRNKLAPNKPKTLNKLKAPN